MSKASKDRVEAMEQVAEKFMEGDRLMCRKNGKTYQMGVKANRDSYWMLCEDDAKKGTVEARVILREFTKMVVGQ
jgi:hypothetical protein